MAVEQWLTNPLWLEAFFLEILIVTLKTQYSHTVYRLCIGFVITNLLA